MGTIAKPNTLSVLLLAFLAVGCTDRENDTLAQDTLYSHLRGVAGGARVERARRDTAEEPKPTALPDSTTGSQSGPVVFHFPDAEDPAGSGEDDPQIRTRHVQVDTIGLRAGAPLPTSRTRADSVAIETQIKNLRTASIYFYAPDTLFISKPEPVEIIIDPKSEPEKKDLRPRIRPATTRVSSRTEVCLSASGFKVEDEEGKENHCRVQVVAFTEASEWHWTVTALPDIRTSDTRQIDVTVNALLDSFPKYTVYTTHHKAYVHVDDPGVSFDRLVSLLDKWKTLLLAIAAIVGVITQVVRWMRSRRPRTGAGLP